MSTDDLYQGYIELTIRTMAPMGASQDLFLRALQPIMRQRFRTAITIDNAAGRDGINAALQVKCDPPDGQHLLVTTASTLTFYPATGEAGFTEADFEPLLGVGRYRFVLITASTQPWSNLDELFAHIRAQGRALRYAGTGEPDLLMALAMAKPAGLTVEFLPRNGPALLDAVLTGEVDLGLGTGTHQPLLADGRVRVVARLHSPTEPGHVALPGPAEFGVNAALDNFILISAPRGLPSSGKHRLVEQLSNVVEVSEVTELLTKRLLMAPGLMREGELEAALTEQKRAFALLREAL